MLGCRKWGCNKCGLKGCLAALPGFRPFSALFRPFPEGPNSTWKIQKTEEKGPFPQISSDLLKPQSLKPPFAALQFFFSNLSGTSGISRQKSQDIPPKSLVFLGFKGHTELFGPHPFKWKTPPLQVEDPHPTQRYPDQKVWVWVIFLA